MKNLARHRLMHACLAASLLLLAAIRVAGQLPAELTLHLEQPVAIVSPRLYGLMTEEINHSYDGGLYGELIRNRNFEDSLRSPAFWSLVQGSGDQCSMSLDRSDPVNDALPVSLRLQVEKTVARVGIANEGYWGIPIKPGTVYQGSLYARQSGTGDLTVSLENGDGTTLYASTTIMGIGAGWQQYHFSLNTGGDIKPTANARLVITTKAAGTYWFSLISLFPPTYNGRANGLRVDIMELLRDLKPRFLRFPGGNYLEGATFTNRFDWKKTIGPVDQRPGHLSPWDYRSTDGLGLLEFLEWCEDLKMEPLLALFAGFVLDHDRLEAGPFLQPFVDDALDEIEYVTGDTTTRWGKRRALDGHPEPFPLHYVEIGNEDGFDYSGSYKDRYRQFFAAIKARYPQLQIIATAGGKDPLGANVPAPEKPDIVDEHYYRSAAQMEEHAGQYDAYSRNGPKILVGEWATREGYPTTNFNSALGDAAWMTGMERNSDLIIMSCYAPLLVNVNPGAMQWRSDLIGYDALTAYGSPSYYAQKLFSNHLGNRVVNIQGKNIAMQWERLTYRDSLENRTVPKQIEALFYVATRDTVSGTIFLKMVNIQPTAQLVRIRLQGTGRMSRVGRKWVLSAHDPRETNTIAEPEKIVPAEMEIKGVSSNFQQLLPAYSITVMELYVK
jgi:alpha-N-arabinofuranosidase